MSAMGLPISHRRLFAALWLILLCAAILLPMTAWALPEQVKLRKTYSGKIDYVATGASFRTLPNTSTADSCTFVTPVNGVLSKSAQVDLPSGAIIQEAYLYFGASGTLSANWDAAPVMTFGRTPASSSPIGKLAGFGEDNYEDNLGGAATDFYGFKREVTNLITGAGSYTLNIEPDHFDATRTNQTCLAAFSVVVVYENPAETSIHVINLFDGFQVFQYDFLELLPRNFVIKDNAKGKMTHITYEGDVSLGGNTGTSPAFEESFYIKVLGDPTFNDNDGRGAVLSNGVNPANNQFNDTVSTPGLVPLTTYGLDVDTYDIAEYMDTSSDVYEVSTHYESAQDGVVLAAEVVRIENKPIADIEVFLNTIGSFDANTVNQSQYAISVRNNGDGTGSGASASDSGFAAGFIHVYDDLPAGITIDSLSDITAPGWNCAATDVAANEIRCFYDLNTLTGSPGTSFPGTLYAGDFLPDIYVTVDIGNLSGAVENIARVTGCKFQTDSCTTYAEKHTDSFQFDAVNNMDPPGPGGTPAAQDLFDIFQKSLINNNVDALSTVIQPADPSNLSTSTKTVVDDNGGSVVVGDSLTYTITLTNTAAVVAAGVSISDAISTRLVYSGAVASNTCGGTPVTSFSSGTLTVSGMTVPANSACAVAFNAVVKAGTNAGVAIDNSASIVTDNGVGATPMAPTLLVSGLASGAKLLYLDELDQASKILTRVVPGSDTSVGLAPNNSVEFTLASAVDSALTVSAGTIPVSVWVDPGSSAAPTAPYTLRARLYRNSTGGALLGDSTINNVQMTAAAGTDDALLFPFQLTNALFTLALGETLVLQITNDSSSSSAVTLHGQLNSLVSNVALNATTVINVDSVLFYADTPGGTLLPSPPANNIEAGQFIYMRAVVSDPFGADDISGATLTLIDPILAEQLANVVMTPAASPDPDKKFFDYVYEVPSGASIPLGSWVAEVTAMEGTEGTVTHTDANGFTTIASPISATYTVSPLTASAGDLLSYTITINKPSSGDTTVYIEDLLPADTTTLTITTAIPNGSINGGDPARLDNVVVVGSGTTVITYTVLVGSGVLPGDLIDNVVSIYNQGPDTLASTVIAASVLIDPFAPMLGNKLIYADSLAGSPTLDRTKPTPDSTRLVASQGGATTLVLAPVLATDLELDAVTNGGVVNVGIWVSRGNSFDGLRTIQADLGYIGASTGSIGVTATQTIQLQAGIAGAQYLPFSFTLAGPNRTILANTSLTLKITNTTAVAGETITLHTIKDGINPSQIALNTVNPITAVVNIFNDNANTPGSLITEAEQGTDVWVVATVQDAFGAADVTAANLTITDPSSTVTLTNQLMVVSPIQPGVAGQKNFQFKHTLSSNVGDWTIQVVAKEGLEDTMTATAMKSLPVAVRDLSDSYKAVANLTTGDTTNNNPGDILHYTIGIVESGGLGVNNIEITDLLDTDVSYEPGSLLINGVPLADSNVASLPSSGSVNLTGAEASQLVSLAGMSELTIEFDVVINLGTAVGTLIANQAGVTADGGVSETLDAQGLVISGVPAAGTKFLYLDDVNGAQNLTRLRPPLSGTDADPVILNDVGSGITSATLVLTPVLTKAITIAPGINVRLLMKRPSGNQPRDIAMLVSVGYANGSGGPVTQIGSLIETKTLNNVVQAFEFDLPSTTVVVPQGSVIVLTVENQQANNGRDAELYAFDAGDFSRVAIVPTPVINVDSIVFYENSVVDEGAKVVSSVGTVVTNPEPGDIVYAEVVISDPFGEADIQGPEDENPSTVTINNPDSNAALSLIAACQVAGDAPCYAYAGEFVDADAGTRTFLYKIITAVAGTRGTWTVQATANEGLETAPLISHTEAGAFTTLSQSNLSTSTKMATYAGDLDVGEALIYVITIVNSGGQVANNASVTDTLQSAPVSLTISGVTTTCTDGSSALVPLVSVQDVSLSGISLAASGGSCTLTINTTVASGAIGATIDNSATITNLAGPGAVVTATTILLSESQIPAAGSKQLYLTGLGGDNFLRRSVPGASSTVLATQGGSVTLTLDLNPGAGIVRPMTITAGAVDVKLYMSSDGANNNQNRDIQVELLIDENDTNGFQVASSQSRVIRLNNAIQFETFNLSVSAPIAMPVGASVQVRITNLQGGGTRVVKLDQVAQAGPVFDYSTYAQVVIPVEDSIAVTNIKFFDKSAIDNGGVPGCEADFSCATEIVPGTITTGFSLWAQATIADAFGAADVNSDCSTVNAAGPLCPAIVLTDPNAVDQTANVSFLASTTLTYLGAAPPSATDSRLYEIEIMAPGVMAGLEGDWSLSITGSEGSEGVIFDSLISGYEVFGQPVLTILKSASGVYSPGSVVTYTNVVENSGFGPAAQVTLTNTVGAFLTLELTKPGAEWTAVDTLTGSYSVESVSFDDTIPPATAPLIFVYDPNATGPCLAVTPPAPCYDPAIRQWRIKLVEPIPVNDIVTETYKVRID
jgi:fimbrial isopeptide formation D2 family protein/uncharacterized repeat protein (TIGR01451 family)